MSYLLGHRFGCHTSYLITSNIFRGIFFSVSSTTSKCFLASCWKYAISVSVRRLEPNWGPRKSIGRCNNISASFSESVQNKMMDVNRWFRRIENYRSYRSHSNLSQNDPFLYDLWVQLLPKIGTKIVSLLAEEFRKVRYRAKSVLVIHRSAFVEKLKSKSKAFSRFFDGCFES